MSIKTEARGCGTRGSYPKLMISKMNGMVILMVDDKCGTVVHKGDSPSRLGGWCEHWGMEYFQDYTGEVVLKNE